MIAQQLLGLLGALSALQAAAWGAERALDGLRVAPGLRARFLRVANGCVLAAIPAYLAVRGFLAPVSQLRLEELAIAGPGPGAPVAAVPSAPISVAALILGFLLFVGALLLARVGWRYRATAVALRAGREAAIRGRAVRLVPGLGAPLSFGVWRGRIFAPPSLTELSERELELALIHEEIHIEGGDLRAKIVSLAARALLWFQPFAYLSHGRLELLLELACDEATMRRTGSRPLEYGGLLLKFGSGSFGSLAASMKGASLTRRVHAMTRENVRRPALTAFSIVSLLLGAGVAVASAGGALDERDQFKVSAKIFVDGRHVSSPTIVTVEGEEASISQVRDDGSDALHMELIATNEPGAAPGAIRLEMRVRSEREGRVVDSRPTLILSENREGTVEVGSRNGPTFSMNVTVDRIEKVRN